MAQESGSAGSAEEADGGSQLRRFEHYEVMLDEAGRPIELGRGEVDRAPAGRFSKVSFRVADRFL
jgi:hypothetical protein